MGANMRVLRPWTQQPQEAVGIDRYSPLTRGLRVLFTGGINWVTGDVAQIHGTVPTSPVQDGIASGPVSGSSDYLSIPASMGVSETTHLVGCTSLVVSIGPASNGCIAGKANGSGNGLVIQPAYMAQYSDRTYLRGKRLSSGPYAADLYRTGGINTSAMRSSGDDVGHYVNGRRNGAAYYIGDYGDWDSSLTTLMLHKAFGDPIVNTDSQLLLLALWDRDLLNEELAAVTDNPWQLFEPQRIWMPVSAGGGSSKSSIFSLTTAVQVSRSVNISASAAVRATRSVSSELSTSIRVSRNSSMQIEAALQRSASASTSLDSAVRLARSAASSVQTAIQTSRSQTANLDAALRFANQAMTTLDAAVQAAHAANVSASAYVQAGNARAASISAGVQAPRNVSLGASVVAQLARQGSADLSAAVQALHEASSSISAQVQAGTTAAANINAAVQRLLAVSVDVSAAVRKSVTASAELSACVSAAHAVSAVVSTAINDPRISSTALSAYVSIPSSGECPTAEEIAAAVLATLNSTVIPVNVKQMNDADVIGDGTDGNPWRGVGVPP